MNPVTKQTDGIHRLLDIVVEEVSLVDRAANKHRFLIVKRSDPMTERQVEKVDEPVNGAPNASSQTPPQAEPPADNTQVPGEDAPLPDSGASMLEVAVSALERLTESVEALGALGEGDARLRVGEIADELRALASQLAEAAGAAPVPESQGGGGDQLALVIAAVRTTLQQVGALLGAAKRANDKPKPEPDKAKKADPASGELPTPPPQDDSLRKDLAGLADAVKKLVEAGREQAQRLSRLEKRFGLPNSTPGAEPGGKPPAMDVNWPLDLNRPLGRESVDKTVSFHD